MSYELYFKSEGSNNDVGLKSWEIPRHKKVTWLAFGTDSYSQVDIQVWAKDLKQM